MMPGPTRPTQICYLGLSRWPEGPGDPRVFQKQLTTLAEEGYSVTALVTGHGPTHQLRGITIRPCGWPGSLWSRLWHLPDVYRQATRERADCYFFGNFELLPVALFLKLRTGARLVYDSMEHYPDMMRVSRQVPTPLRNLLACLVDLSERLMTIAVDYVIAADTPTLRRFSWMGRTQVIFNYPLTDLVDSSTDVLHLGIRKKYFGRKVMVFVGSMGWDRGLREMAESTAIIRSKYPSILLCLIGLWQDARIRIEFESLVNHLGIEDCVDIVGPVPHAQIGAYLGVADLGISLLAESEKHQKNISTKQFDYMNAGIPSVVNLLDPFLDYTGRASAGLVVRSLDPNEVASSLDRLLANDSLRMTLGRNGRRFIENQWNWGNEAVKLVSVFDQVLRMPQRLG